MRPVSAAVTRPINLEEHDLPPARGLPLGLRLGLTVAVIVTLTTGAMTVYQQRREMARDRRDREALLAESLAPLAAAVERASSLDEINDRLAAFQEAYVDRGHPDHQVALRDGDGRVVASSFDDWQYEPPDDDLRARVEIRSALLPEGRGTLQVWRDASAFKDDMAHRWQLVGLDIVVTILTIIATLQIAIFLLISRPLGQLVRSLRRMEQGHLGEVESPRGAWEVRWLAWRLERTALELKETVRRLVSAERRALEQSQVAGNEDRRSAADGAAAVGGAGGAEARAQRDTLSRQYLTDTARLLESLDADDPAARPLAEDAWERSAPEAARIGAMGLRARLENTALRILDPAAFTGLSRRLAAVNAARRGWVQEREEQLERALAEGRVSCLGIQHRVKHLAGIWRKMQEKQLDLEQVHDLFAFRVIVHEERDCYLALGALHRAFEPEPFRFKDYIAEPKPNGYQSIHTSLRGRDGVVFEVQIRSAAMHRLAENGAAAHWRYKAESPATPLDTGRLGRLVRNLGARLHHQG